VTAAVINPDGAFVRIATRSRPGRAGRCDLLGGASNISGTGWGRTAWGWASPAGAAVTLTVVVWRLGAGPFLDGVRAVDAGALAAAAAVGLLTTVCCAWRWTIVARGLGVRLSLPAAVAAYYRSLFLNLTLPGGVVGDVHRGVSHGRDVDDVGRGLRAVAWERTAGQVVQVVLTVAVLLALPSPVRSWMPLVAIALVTTVIGIVLLGRVRPGGERSRWARLRDVVAGDVRDGLLTRRALPVIALTSAVVVLGHAVTFLIAARSAGATAPASRMLPLALLAMMAMVLPSVAGWGPREGATAWVFGAAGLGAGQGVATAVVYGVIVLAASLPGAVVLVAVWLRRRPSRRPEPLPGLIQVAGRPDGAADV
jgi:glycosyltransferase 2 family protein